MRYCVLGKKLSHSLSPTIHADYFRRYGVSGEYCKREVSEEEWASIGDIVGNFDGLNVTVPYKEKIISALDDIRGDAKVLGAVNTVVKEGEKYIGYNTDTYGFEALLRYNGIAVKDKTCVVLGSGGASKAVAYCLEQAGADKVLVVSRTPSDSQISYEELKSVKGYLIVNTTPVGMSPNVGVSPVDKEVLSNFQVAVDVVYNPSLTEFLAQASEQGLYIANGLYMLVAQAVKSQEYWQKIAVDESWVEQEYKRLKTGFDVNSGNNIYLVGMMGCGKTTVGKALSKALGKKLVDSDSEIEKLCGKSIPQIFESEGEEAFRKYESKVLARLAKCKGLVVATGGGIVKNPINTAMLRASGSVVWLNRNPHLIVDDCDTSNRPLLKGKSQNVLSIFEERKLLYKSSADVEVANDMGVSECLKKIRDALR
ncbi:MAG: shikimate kinase [Christensenellales bacterium]